MWENLGNMMEVIKKIQQNLEYAQDELKKEKITVSSGDAITVIINGQQEILSIELSPKYLTSDNFKLLQDLLVSTINNGLQKSKELNQTVMGKVTNELNLPKIPGLF